MNRSKLLAGALFLALMGLLPACKKSPPPSPPAPNVAGVWLQTTEGMSDLDKTMAAKILPATPNLLQLTLKPDGTFQMAFCSRKGAPLNDGKSIEGTLKWEYGQGVFAVTSNTFSGDLQKYAPISTFGPPTADAGAPEGSPMLVAVEAGDNIRFKRRE
ncbi:MAG: hypothetical protein HZB38_08835 [Planctomycetes bacterium]|nr:hypothetical protein [Planctomycetota bacterium]